MEAIVRAAGVAVGVELADFVDLGGSGRSVVLRCRPTTGGSVIVKAFNADTEAMNAFASEVSGLSLGIAGPELLGVDTTVPLLVMADLGDVPTLADVLLGDDPEVAERSLATWAQVLGELAARSVERQADFSLLQAEYGGTPAQDSWLTRNIGALPTTLATAGMATPPGLVEELAQISRATSDYPAFTPGDTCPDNSLLTPEGLRLIDFEAACYQSVLLTAAYTRMPFSTCWCVFRLPPDVAEEIEQIYRTQVVEAYPALADDTVWHAGVRGAVAAWTAAMTTLMLPRAGEDAPAHPTRRPVPTRRQLLRHRWEMASALDEFPAFADTMRVLLRDFAATWDVSPLVGYPAFAD